MAGPKFESPAAVALYMQLTPGMLFVYRYTSPGDQMREIFLYKLKPDTIRQMSKGGGQRRLVRSILVTNAIIIISKGRFSLI